MLTSLEMIKYLFRMENDATYGVIGIDSTGQAHRLGLCDLLTAEQLVDTCQKEGIEAEWIYPEERSVFASVVGSV